METLLSPRQLDMNTLVAGNNTSDFAKTCLSIHFRRRKECFKVSTYKKHVINTQSDIFIYSAYTVSLFASITPRQHDPLRMEGEGKAGLDRPRGFQEVEAPRFQDNRHMKAVGLSARRTGRLYPPGNIPGTHLC